MKGSLMAATVAAALSAGGACGQDFPTKPVRIVTSAVGSGSDYVTRLIAQEISGPLGQQVIVDNRTPLLAIETVAKAPADGYTILLTGGAFGIGPLLQKLSYDPVRDFTPITLALRTPNVLVVHPSLPAKSVKELIALAKAKPGELNYSSGGTGGSSHLAGALFSNLAGINIVRIPYKSDSQEMADLLAGQTQMSFQDGSKVAQHIKSGKLRSLAVGSAEPSPLAPGLPTVAASLPGFVSVTMTGMWAPAKTPVANVRRLNQEIVRALNQPNMKQKFLESGAEPVGSTPEELAAALKADTARLEKLIKDTGIKIE